MEYVKRIANVDKRKRRDAILSILSEHNIPFKLYGQIKNKHYTENIVVTVNPRKKRYVIGAHYDNVEGSIAAVDNASGVSVLLRLIFAVYSSTDKAIDFVFFDREEYDDRGSEAYVESVGKDNIIAMLNLDPCGYGDTIAVHKMYRGNDELLDKLFSAKVCSGLAIKMVDFMPNGDHMSFYGNGIKTVTVSAMSKELAECFNKIAAYCSFDNGYSGDTIPQNLIDEFMNSYDMTTFHNGKNDKLETVSQKIMDSLVQYLTGVFLSH